ncbi:MAG: hypothetical protein JWM03_789 [Rhodocyclales bacterium]|nr:hypothetical protein [Rhodocyclales bacterium]
MFGALFAFCGVLLRERMPRLGWLCIADCLQALLTLWTSFAPPLTLKETLIAELASTLAG